MRQKIHAAPMGEMRNAYMFAGKPEGKRPLVIPSRRWKNIIEMDLK
jgi:hypothetical protein